MTESFRIPIPGDNTPDTSPESPDAQESHQAGADSPWPKGRGEMVRRIGEFDWSRTPIGPVESWSPAFQMIIKLMPANRFPMILWWGLFFPSHLK
jgi:hypothetical protein